MTQNIKYELQEIERIISVGETHAEIKRSTLPVLSKQLTIEVERIKKTLTHEVFNFDDERHLERYIQFHQQALIGLLDKLNHQSQVHASTKKEYFTLMYTYLDMVLKFVERHFVKYFDQDAKAPEGYLALARKELSESMEKLVAAFSERKAAPTLVSLLLQVVQYIIDSKPGQEITFRKVMYAKEMQKELFLLLERNSIDDINEELRQIMYYLNYNSVKVITDHAHYISSLLESAETRTEKIERLSLVMKNVSQAQVKPGIKYNHKASSLKEQLLEFIAVEMEYQERLQRLNTPTSQGPGSPLSGFKLKFDASVSQLAYLIKIFIETKLIANTNLTQIIQFLAMFAITKKSESLSFTSFRTKFYNVEIGTKQSVRGMLTSMIHYIDSTY